MWRKDEELLMNSQRLSFTLFLVLSVSLVSPPRGLSEDVILSSTTFELGFSGPLVDLIPPPQGIVLSWGLCTSVGGLQNLYSFVFDTIGTVLPSNDPQTFEIYRVDDPDFDSVSSAIQDSATDRFTLISGYDSTPSRISRTGISLGLSAPGSTVEKLVLTITPFKIATERLPAFSRVRYAPRGFDRCSPLVTIEAFGIGNPGTFIPAPAPSICDNEEIEFLFVEIDIKPGSDPNSINLQSEGVIPVAIITTPDFDASVVDVATVTLSGASARLRGRSQKVGSLEDVDGDGDLDMVVQFEVQDTSNLRAVFSEAVLVGKTISSVDIMGVDSIVVVRE